MCQMPSEKKLLTEYYFLAKIEEQAEEQEETVESDED
jgi:hypothetical protein